MLSRLIPTRKTLVPLGICVVVATFLMGALRIGMAFDGAPGAPAEIYDTVRFWAIGFGGIAGVMMFVGGATFFLREMQADDGDDVMLRLTLRSDAALTMAFGCCAIILVVLCGA